MQRYLNKYLLKKCFQLVVLSNIFMEYWSKVRRKATVMSLFRSKLPQIWTSWFFRETPSFIALVLSALFFFHKSVPYTFCLHHLLSYKDYDGSHIHLYVLYPSLPTPSFLSNSYHSGIKLFWYLIIFSPWYVTQPPTVD